MGALMREHDWGATALGPVAAWPTSLRTSVSTCLNSRFAILIWWGPELVMLYNDAYREIIGSKHPAALGMPGRKCFPEIWPIIGPMLDNVLSRGEATRSDDLPLYLERHGYAEECYFTFSYSPIRDESGGVGGVFTPVEESTEKVIGARRLQTLQQLASRSRGARDVIAVCESAAQTLNANLTDVPFSGVYLRGHHSDRAELVARSGDPLHGEELPAAFLLSDTGSSDESAERSAAAPQAWDPARLSPPPPSATVVLPLLTGQASPGGFLVAGISQNKHLDTAYRTFFELVAGQIAAAITEARAYEEERKRAEALAELDRAKTRFFSNVSHEFRTPLTLIMAPVEDALRGGTATLSRDDLALVHQNGLRLLKLVNTLLDFSRIEAGRARSNYEPTDLAVLTADVASCFRSALEKGGLRYTVDCQPLGEVAFVDRDMWEKIVLNLLSNAFKFTVKGEVAVSLRRVGSSAELVVKDTGVGISPDELPRVFERFHRVEGVSARTHEGTGIGLSFVQDLVQLHGGEVRAESTPGKGSTFTVSIPLGSSHLPADRIRSTAEQPRDETVRMGYVGEALRWLPEETPAEADTAVDATPVYAPSAARILLVEDNADMRSYLRRILASRYEVTAVTDGEAALAELRAQAYDLVLSDVMMPRLDGFQLLEQIRKDAEISTTPVILLSARAGEDEIEGLRAGADSYLVKPFNARDLLARVESQMSISRLRLRVAKKDRELREHAERERQRWHGLLKNAPAAIALLRGPELIFEMVNDEYVRTSGRLSPTEFEGKRFRDAVPELVEQGYAELLAQVYRTGQPAFGNRRRMKLQRTSDGSMEERFFTCTYQPWRGSTGEIEGVFVHAVDVTEEVIAERRLQESQSQFRDLADSIPNLAWIADSSGARSWFNRRWYDYTGLTEEETTGWGWIQIYPPDQVNSVLTSYKRAFEAGEVWEQTVRLRGGTGEYRWFLSRAIPMRNSEGRAVRWFGTSTDVNFEIEAQQRMAEAQRLESIGRLAGGIAHDFNNLLVPILGCASLASDALPPDHSIQPLFADVEQSCERAANLTRQLLAYAGKTRFHLTDVDVETIARESVALASASISKNIEIAVESTPGVPAVQADRGEVQQILMNLLLNAAEAIGDRRGVIRVRIGLAELAKSPGAGLLLGENIPPGTYVCMEVSDTGCGIDEATQRKMLEPFFSTKFVGRGLGLAAVAGIIRAHEWGLAVESAPGQGCTFRVFLRAAPREAKQPAAPAQVLPAAGSGSILVVDDEEVVRRMAKLSLEYHGYRVLLAENGSAAIRLFQAAGGAIDLVLLDLTMPGMSGHEILAALRRINPEVKALVSSGYSEEQALPKFSGQPVVGFIQKPYTPIQLAARINAVLR